MVEHKQTTECPHSTLRYYTDHAEEYAAQTQLLDLAHLWDLIQKRVPVGSTILDLGCGAGRDLRAFKARGFKPIGLDFSAPLLHLARCFANCPVVLADLREIPFKEQSFGAVSAIASLLHVTRERIAHTLTGVCHVVAPGGVFVASIKLGRGEGYDRSGRLFTYYGCDEWRVLTERAGFEIELLEKEKEQRWSQHGDDLSVDWLMVVSRKPARF